MSFSIMEKVNEYLKGMVLKIFIEALYEKGKKN